MMGIGLIEPAQAQKHVTVNEALIRLDALASGQVLSAALSAPPTGAVDGDRFVVAAGAAGDWAGHAGEIAFRVNGGWEFHVPWAGFRAYDAARAGWIFHDGEDWRPDAIALSPGRAASVARIMELDHPIGAGPTSSTAVVIPDKAVVLGVTARVIEAITGAASWQLGTADGADRYGSGIGVAAGAYAHGVSGTPLAYYGGTALVLTAEGGAFTGGRVKIAVHLLEIEPPR
jgi:hypothetical protein